MITSVSMAIDKLIYHISQLIKSTPDSMCIRLIREYSNVMSFMAFFCNCHFSVQYFCTESERFSYKNKEWNLVCANIQNIRHKLYISKSWWHTKKNDEYCSLNWINRIKSEAYLIYFNWHKSIFRHSKWHFIVRSISVLMRWDIFRRLFCLWWKFNKLLIHYTAVSKLEYIANDPMSRYYLLFTVQRTYIRGIQRMEMSMLLMHFNFFSLFFV